MDETFGVPVFLAWHCAFHALAFRCHQEKLPCWRLALALEAVRGASLRPLLLCSILTFFLADKMHVVIVMENDTWETQGWMKPKFASPVAVWQRHLSSSGHFVMMCK